MLPIWLLACGLNGGDSALPLSDDDDDDDDGEIEIVVDPPALAFDAQALGWPTSIWLRIDNDGDVEALLVDMAITEGRGLTIEPPSSLSISPGGSTGLTVTWIPLDVGTMDAAVTLTVGATMDDTEQLEVPITGEGEGAKLALSASDYDFGSVKVGCSRSFTLTVSNAGNEDVTVDAASAEGDAGFSVEAEGLPWTLAPFGSQQLTVTFAPTDRVAAAGLVSLSSDAGEMITTLSGSGTVDGETELSFIVGDQNRATMLFHVNQTAIPGAYGTYSKYFESALPTFFQTLKDNRTKFRAAFLWNTSGAVDGDIDYIDETYSASEATEIVLEMIAAGSPTDNDASFTTLMNGLTANEDWLFDGEEWSESKLSLIAINRDVEQSGGSAKGYVTQAQSTKQDAEDLVFHAIAGSAASGCEESFATFATAVDATGGLFLNLCATDWTDHMSQLAAACMDGADFFALTGTPLVSSLEVQIDGVEASGWSYDSALNAIVFDEATYPEDGAEITVRYFVTKGCG